MDQRTDKLGSAPFRTVTRLTQRLRCAIRSRRNVVPIEGNKGIIRRFFQNVVNKGDIATIDEIVATDFVEQGPLSEMFPGSECLKQYTMLTRAAFPDIHVTIEDLIAEGDKVVARVMASGSHKGEYMGVPPTHMRITVSEIHIARIVGGKVVEHWSEANTLGLMQQLGVLPGPG